MRLIFSVALFLTIHVIYGQSSKEAYKIYWDERLIKGREQFLAQTHPTDSSGNRPNIIIILADDLGQTDISLYGNKLISTPNIDAIGKNGITFNEAYITSPVCSPSRAGLLTGRYQQRFGHELQMNDRYPKNIIEFLAFKILPTFRPVTPIWIRSKPSDEDRMRQGLPPSEITLAEVLKANGYATGIIGKWHLGAQDFALPCNRGFDYQYGFNEAFTLYMNVESLQIINGKVKGQYMDSHQWHTAEGRTGNCAITRNCSEPTDDPDYLTDRLTTEAIQFIDRNKTQSFFLYLPYSAPHAPIQAPKRYYDQLPHVKDHVQRTYLAMIKNLDDQIGRLMKNLDSLKVTENTLIFFLSDNGGASYNGSTNNAPYRGGKLTNFEGGIRVPFMLQWKGQIPKGVVFNQPVSSLDIFATAASAAKAQLPQDRTFDGVDLTKYINETSTPHTSLYWRSDVCKAIRQKQWKLMINEVSGTNSLYNMVEDAREENNLYDQLPDVVRQLHLDLQQWESSMMKPMWPRTVNYIYKDKQGKQKFAF